MGDKMNQTQEKEKPKLTTLYVILYAFIFMVLYAMQFGSLTVSDFDFWIAVTLVVLTVLHIQDVKKKAMRDKNG